jgi:hypothetical protein
MSTTTIDIKQYDFSTIPQTGFIEILGKRGTGKTTWTQYILTQSPSKDQGLFIVIGGSETVKESWSQFIHPLYVHDASIEYLERLRDQRNARIRHFQRLRRAFPTSEHVTLVFDDIASNKKIMRSPILGYLASNSRHLHMSIIILAQYHCQIPPEIRNQFDFVVILATSDAKTIGRVHSEFCSIIDLRSFRSVLAFATQKHGACIINNQSASMEITDVISYGLMETYPVVVQELGSPQLWTFARERYIDVDMVVPSKSDAEQWVRKRSQDEDSESVSQRDDDNDTYSKSAHVAEHVSRFIHTDRHGKIVVRKV